MPVGLAWHICAQLASALLFLHYGSYDGRREPDWPHLAHGDLHAHNILFQSVARSEQGCGNYPNAFVMDFGSAWHFERQSANSRDRDAVLHRQRMDMESLGSITLSLSHRVDDSALSNALDLLDSAERPHSGALWNESACRTLRAFLKVCEKKREELYQPLCPADFEAYFDMQVATDEEIEEAFPALKQIESPVNYRKREASLDESECAEDRAPKQRKRSD